MQDISNYLCFIHNNTELYNKIKNILCNKYPAIFVNRLNEISLILKNKIITCIIIYINDSFDYNLIELIKLGEEFPGIPKIAIMNNHELGVARRYGQLGFDFVISIDHIHEIDKYLINVKYEKCQEISFHRFGISINECSTTSKRILSILKKYYLKLNSIQEIAEILGISNAFLSREFKRNFNITPKIVLNYFKIYHAEYLIKNSGLKLKEISKLIGYNYKTFNYCFKKIFGDSPSMYRKKMNVSQKIRINVKN